MSVIHQGVRSSAIDLHSNPYMVAWCNAREQDQNPLSLDLYDWRMLNTAQPPVKSWQPPETEIEEDWWQASNSEAPYMAAAGPTVMLAKSCDYLSAAFALDAFNWAHGADASPVFVLQPALGLPSDDFLPYKFRLSDNGQYLLDWCWQGMHIHGLPFGVEGAKEEFHTEYMPNPDRWGGAYMYSVDMMDTLVVAAGCVDFREMQLMVFEY